MAILIFSGISMSLNAYAPSEPEEPCITIAFAIEEELGYEIPYEDFEAFVDSCKKWPIWNECGCVLIQ